MRNSLIVALIISGAVTDGVSQGQQIPAPGTALYRSGTAILRVDASVLDANGRTVRDLQPSDFQVEIDGRPRKVLFADLPEPVLLSRPRRPRLTSPTADAARGAPLSFLSISRAFGPGPSGPSSRRPLDWSTSWGHPTPWRSSPCPVLPFL